MVNQNLILSNNKPSIKHFSLYSDRLNLNTKILELLYSEDTKENIQINIVTYLPIIPLKLLSLLL